MCSVPSCHDYSGKYKKDGYCKYHQNKFELYNIINEEQDKVKNTAHPVHNSGKVKVIYGLEEKC